MRPQDLVAIIGFGEEVDLFTGFTCNQTALKFAVAQLEAAGPSRLYDGVVRAAELYGAVGGDCHAREQPHRAEPERRRRERGDPRGRRRGRDQTNR